MPLTLGSNIASLRALRELGKSSDLLSKTFERLSSGQRINRASDDAAGLSVSTKLTSDSRVFAQGVRNLSDGISLLSIAESALQELSKITLRQTELAEQASNGIYSTAQRLVIDKEVQALAREYNRIMSSTSFNGIQLFSGAGEEVSLQAGYSAISGIVGGQVARLVGDGTFQAVVTHVNAGITDAVTLADFNGDGVLDLVSGGQGVAVRIRLGNGDGTFTSGTGLTAGNKFQVVKFTVGDVNGDGFNDIISPEGYSNSVSVLLGNGNGTFKASISSFAANARDASASDVNGDGLLDLIVTDDINSKTNILIGNGDGTFRAGVTYASGGLFIAHADFNGDDRPDFVTTDGLSFVYVSLGNGNGSFGSAVTITPSPFSTTVTEVAAADVNGDGIIDLVTGNGGGTSSVQVFIGNGNGTFRTGNQYSVPFSGTRLGMALTDLNSDGYSDIVMTNDTGNTVSVLLGSGDGTFSAARSFAAGTGVHDVSVGDVNGDGVPDLVAADFSGTSIGVLIANTQYSTLQTPISVRTRNEALQALETLRATNESISLELSALGAFESRITSAQNHLQSMRENYLAAARGILDVDIAGETAEMVRLQILQQAGAAVLAQANLQPGIVLKLLG